MYLREKCLQLQAADYACKIYTTVTLGEFSASKGLEGVNANISMGFMGQLKG